MGNYRTLVAAEELLDILTDVVVLDCRFQLGDAGAGARAHAEGHIPGAHYVHLERDLSGPLGERGGRHPLPEPARFSARMAALGVGRETPVVAYDDNGFMPAARLWWMLKALDFKDVRLLNGGIGAWKAAGGGLDTAAPRAQAVTPAVVGAYNHRLEIDGVRRAISSGSLLLDARDAARYQGLEEPIDPVAGHIPGALNLPWQGVTDSQGYALDEEAQLSRLSVVDRDRELVAYCGSGVTACVNLLALHLVGHDEGKLYGGSWSDWCSHLSGEI